MTIVSVKFADPHAWPAPETAKTPDQRRVEAEAAKREKDEKEALAESDRVANLVAGGDWNVDVNDAHCDFVCKRAAESGWTTIASLSRSASHGAQSLGVPTRRVTFYPS